MAAAAIMLWMTVPAVTACSDDDDVIVGNITIGNNVLIAPGAYVNFDVPDGSIVIGNPGLIRRAPGATHPAPR